MSAAEGNKAQTTFESAVRKFTRRDIEAAAREFLDAESAGYDADSCAAYRWNCWMLSGRFEEAWRESRLIASRGGADPNALCDGSPMGGKRVVLRRPPGD